MSSSPADRPFLNREVLGWAGFDFANSSYTTLITTVAFSVYFSEAIVGVDNRWGDWWWACAGVTVNVILILVSPVFGALADFSGRKKRFLLFTAIVTVVGTAMLALLGPGMLWPAMVLYVIASVGFEGGYVFYNAFLPEVSTPETSGRVSALAWGVGFLGGLAALVACYPFLGQLTDENGVLSASAVSGYRVSFVIVAAFFALFSVPTFVFLRESPGIGRIERAGDYVRVGFRRVADTLTHLRQYRQTAKFVVAYLCYFGGINAVIRFSAIYANQTFDIKGGELTFLYIFANIVGMPGTLVFGWLADRIGQKRTLALTLLIWVAVAIAGALAEGKTVFWLITTGAAIGMGSTQAIGRSFMSRLAPLERESEFFGFYVLAGQVGSILGLLSFGLVSGVTGSQRLAVAGTTLFFLIGLILTLSVRESEGSGEAV